MAKASSIGRKEKKKRNREARHIIYKEEWDAEKGVCIWKETLDNEVVDEVHIVNLGGASRFLGSNYSTTISMRSKMYDEDRNMMFQKQVKK